jgi:hypothetical protein
MSTGSLFTAMLQKRIFGGSLKVSHCIELHASGAKDDLATVSFRKGILDNRQQKELKEGDGEIEMVGRRHDLDIEKSAHSSSS